jgi:phosphoglycerate dehydrogenase-like enzyme
MKELGNKSVFFGSPGNQMMDKVFDSSVIARLQQHVELYPEYINPANAEEHKEWLDQVEVAFSTWGMPTFTEDQIRAYMPNLKVVFYGAGSVQRFARPFLSCGVILVSAWAANAVPVAEYTAAQIILANKGFFASSAKYKSSHAEAKSAARIYPGNYGARVGLLGAGMIGRKVIEFLKPYELAIDVYDPYLSEEKAGELGVTKTELHVLFSRCDTISNHIANLPATVGMLNKDCFDRMLPHATFINTGRGAQVVEADLIQALRDVPTRTAILDVTFPEPVKEDSEFLRMDNVYVTPHIAGSMNQEVARMGHYIADECGLYFDSKPLQFQVTWDMLESMA